MPMLDEIQGNLSTKFSTASWLSKQENVERIIDWITFYRRNIVLFILHYFGFSLYLYQAVILTQIHAKNTTSIIACRAAAKSWLLALYACAKCVLYPNTKIVICSSTKKQASLIVTEKIVKDLMQNSPNLAREIKKINTGSNDIEVIFRNGSSIIAVAPSDRSRGYRSNVLILEEFRQMDKEFVDRVAKPFQIARVAPYHALKQYSRLLEEPTTVYISSSGTTGEWIWDVCKDMLGGMLKGESKCLLAFDYSVVLRYGIKTKRQLIDDKHTVDPITWRIEYENEMMRENKNAFFTYSMLVKNQREKKCFYPRRDDDIRLKKKNPYEIPRQEGEIRILSCDVAFVDKKENDNSVFSCMRLLPESTEYRNQTSEGNSISIKQGYRRLLPYLESSKGGDVDRQAIRIKQLYDDFDADYVVLDVRNGGILIYDRLAKILYDEDRDKEYPAWSCMNDENISNRVKVAGAKPVVFAVTATPKLNSDIAASMRDVLLSQRIDLLISYNDAIDNRLNKIPEYVEAMDGETMAFYERPYLETQALISEMVALEYEIGKSTGVFHVFEVSSNTKDRYTSVSYGNYFASLLEQDLLSDNEEYRYTTLVN